MKFLKLSLFTTLVFAAFIVIFFYSACERNVCNNVTCFNGGSCNVGTCRCPLGWEDPQCQTRSIDRFLGNYAGFSTCDNQAQIFDSAQIRVDDDIKGVMNLTVALKSKLPKVFHGYVSNNESTYAILITNNDSVYTDTTLYTTYYTVTLQDDKKLTINSYSKHYSPTDTTITKCTFLGTKLH